jgi:hypothetical protein
LEFRRDARSTNGSILVQILSPQPGFGSNVSERPASGGLFLFHVPKPVSGKSKESEAITTSYMDSAADISWLPAN